MGGTKVERERKFEGGGAETRLSARGLPGVVDVVAAPDEDLDAVYYDTPDLRLLARDATLRKRCGGHDAGWHLKRRIDADRREELQVPEGAPGAAEDAVPDALRRRVTALARGVPLVPVLRMRTRREREQLVDAHGAPLAEVAHDHVAAEVLESPGRAEAWSELEVELTGDGEGAGADGLLDAVEKQLGRHGWHRSDHASKTARVFENDVEAPRRPRAGTIGHVVYARIAEQTRELLAADAAVRVDSDDGVHDMRVAARRLRSVLRSYRRYLKRSTTDPIADELRWLGRVLGDARDHQVLAERLRDRAGLLAEHADAATAAELAVVATTAYGTETEAYRAAYVDAVDELERERYFRLLDALEAVIAEPPLRPKRARKDADDEVRRVLGREQKRVGKRMEPALAAPGGAEGDQALHSARKAAKRARYAAEAGVPALGGRAERAATRVKRMQRLLGEHQDAVVSRSALRRLAADAHAARANTFAYGVLYAAEQRTAEDVEAQVPEAWRRARKALRKAAS
ncbi:CYTH and CHAD domain-containing protein [Yinghuangia seranimata]|uniref:CYTH and CHAD domain-containing protein n=1 Tax=Yinghuangia seranimata TaxID=408067 RepID=UPI00248C27FE|nr:CYTH and CHAD domain-containing protein [Yinghuangia seranimata]MDI2128329.1 CYTH and CHAD domain-containing protein [Yinghuangia seranimata]